MEKRKGYGVRIWNSGVGLLPPNPKILAPNPQLFNHITFLLCPKIHA